MKTIITIAAVLHRNRDAIVLWGVLFGASVAAAYGV
jgi:hypothetical protein